jgi:DUF4097 and DUF4098 domain-containing protein YvlB
MEQSFATHEPVAVTVEIPAGQVEIEGTETDETRVEVERIGRDLDPSRIEVDLRDEGGRQHLVVLARYERFKNAKYRVVIRTHAGSDLRIETASADVQLRGTFGAAEVNSASGNIEGGEFRGNARLGSVSGNVRLSDAHGEVDLHSTSGRLALGRARARADLHSVSGDVTVDEASADISARTVSGDVRLGSVARGAIMLHSMSGDIDVGIRVGAKAFIDAHSMTGRMRSDLDVTDDPATPGAPDVEIRANTMSGDVAIRRSGQAA